MGSGLTEIGESALNTSGTYSGHLLIPDSVTTIGKTAFNGLKFSSISLGKAVSTIGQSAFANCTSIHSLDVTAVSNSVTYGDSAFHSLRNPNTIYVNSDSQKSAISAAITDGRTAFAITNGGTFPVTTQFSADQLATPERPGYNFEGWYTDEQFTQKLEENAQLTVGSTYYAKWTESTGVTVTFDAQGGTVTPKEMFYENGKVSELPTPTRDGYDFVGWFTEAGIQVNVNDTLPKGDPTTDGGEVEPVTAITLYAHWTAQQPGGGNGGGYYHPTTTPVPVIVIPPKTGDMTVWQSILHFLGIR